MDMVKISSTHEHQWSNGKDHERSSQLADLQATCGDRRGRLKHHHSNHSKQQEMMFFMVENPTKMMVNDMGLLHDLYDLSRIPRHNNT